MRYKRLTLEERERIHALLNQGKSNREIAADLNRSHTTISRELKRCGNKDEYSPSKAQKQADKNAPEKGRKRILDIRPEVFEEVFKRLLRETLLNRSANLSKKNMLMNLLNGSLMKAFIVISMLFQEKSYEKFLQAF